MGAVTISKCTDCEMFIGPSTSTTIQEAKKYRIIIATAKLKLVKCSNVQLLLFSQEAPVFEDCSDVTIGCFDYFYFELRSNIWLRYLIGQFDQVNLNIWNNHWSEIELAKYLPISTRVHDLIQAKEIAELGDISPPDSPREDLQILVPRTVGRSLNESKYVTLFYLNTNRAYA